MRQNHPLSVNLDESQRRCEKESDADIQRTRLKIYHAALSKAVTTWKETEYPIHLEWCHSYWLVVSYRRPNITG